MRQSDFPENATCPRCGGAIENKTITRTVNLKPGTLVVNDVPAGVCEICSEIFLMLDVAKKIDELSLDAKSRETELEIVGYTRAKVTEMV